MLENKDNYYLKIIKSLGFFGGVQLLLMLLSLIKSKFVAILLGPLGMGIWGMLVSSISTIETIISFGLGTSGIRNISSVYIKGDVAKFSIVVSAFNRLIKITGLVGLFLTMILSPFLSKLSFGNYNFVFAYIILSFVLLFNQINLGNIVLLRSTNKFKEIGYIKVLGNFLGLLISILLFYLFGLSAIVYVIIINSVINYIFGTYYSKKINYEKINISVKQSFYETYPMIKTGFLINLNALINFLIAYMLKIYILRKSNLETLGLFNAGYGLATMYVQLFFSAMSIDFYPRLINIVEKEPNKLNNILNQQSEITILVLTPLLIFFIVFIKILIFAIYSEKFLDIDSLTIFILVGTIFKALGWVLGYVSLSRNKIKLYFFNEVIANFYFLIINILLFNFLGIIGLGIGYLLNYFLYYLQLLIVCKIYFNYKLSKTLKKLLTIQLLICGFAITLYFHYTILGILIYYLIGFILILLSIAFSLYYLNKILDFNLVFKNIHLKFKH